jgi:hypothetical protein
MRRPTLPPEIIIAVDPHAEPCDPRILDAAVADLLLDLVADRPEDRALPRLMAPAERRTRPPVPLWRREWAFEQKAIWRAIRVKRRLAVAV